MIISALIKPSGVVLVTKEGRTLTVPSDSPQFEAIKAALRVKDYEQALKLADVATQVKEAGQGKVVVQGGAVFYAGTPVHGTIVDRILAQHAEGFDIGPVCRFLDKLMGNPSHRAVTKLYDFLEHANLPLTEDGDFIAYKKVRPDYKDIHSGAFDNSVGARPSMPRNAVNEDPEQTCSNGLHVCSQEYLPHFGSTADDRVMIVQVNPADVVAIPKDYNDTKMRVCAYTVIGEVGVDAASVDAVREKKIVKRDANGRFCA